MEISERQLEQDLIMEPMSQNFTTTRVDQEFITVPFENSTATLKFIETTPQVQENPFPEERWPYPNELPRPEANPRLIRNKEAHSYDLHAAFFTNAVYPESLPFTIYQNMSNQNQLFIVFDVKPSLPIHTIKRHSYVFTLEQLVLDPHSNVELFLLDMDPRVSRGTVTTVRSGDGDGPSCLS